MKKWTTTAVAAMFLGACAARAAEPLDVPRTSMLYLPMKGRTP